MKAKFVVGMAIWMVLLGLTGCAGRERPADVPVLDASCLPRSPIWEQRTQRQMIQGVHYFSHSRDGQYQLEELVQNHVRHLVLVPYAYQEYADDPNLRFGGRRRGGAHRDSLYAQLAGQAQDLGLQLIVKPHIWMRTNAGKWRSDIAFEQTHEFELWARNYRAFILHYARLSERLGASHFCIGTELASLTKRRSTFWRALIADVRAVYRGQVFYAANWYEEYEAIDFWADLDYIGIQAYFPLCETPEPSVSELRQAWKPHVAAIRRVQQKFDKPVLFTEVGYKSTDDAAASPWEWVDGDKALTKNLSTQTQANCYEAFFRTFWEESWFEGALIWQWRGNHARAGGAANVDFTPQNKPAQQVMARWFAGGS